MSKDLFSKYIPNVKLATRFDADGNEINVEIREDAEASQSRKKIFDLLLSAGYFRVMIKNISDFDKIVGGMSWCIEACDFDVDVDLLFHENLTIGQKISLVERVVKVLPQMSCPFALEPHQIQGLDYKNGIFPVIQWLVKESVNLRNLKAERLKMFAVGQFHNHFKMPSSQETKKDRVKAVETVKSIENEYALKRQFKRKQIAEPEDKASRVRLTLLEYGVKSISRSLPRDEEIKSSSTNKENINNSLEQDETNIDHLLSENLAEARDENYKDADLSKEDLQKLAKHYENLKTEIMIDPKELTEQNRIKNLESVKNSLEKRLERLTHENIVLSNEIKMVVDEQKSLMDQSETIVDKIKKLEIQEEQTDVGIKKEIEDLILQNEQMKQEEIAFKENCKKHIEDLHEKIEEAEALAALPDDETTEKNDELDQIEETLKLCRLQLAKKNRAVISLQRQLDNIPDHTELAQYQKRFLELYNNIGLKHKETKQFYALYNSLNDTHLYLDKELTLLNSIYDNYNQAMATVHSKEQFLKKFEVIAEGVSATKAKIKRKCDDEKAKRDEFNSELMGFIELQRKYAAMIKQFKTVCEKC